MVKNATRPLCKSKRKDGKPCRAPSINNGFCFAHSPELADKAKEARINGGKNKATAVRLNKLMPQRLRPIYNKLEKALGEVHTGELDPRKASAMASLSSVLIKVLTTGELEERVLKLEESFNVSDSNEPKKTN